MLLHFYHWIKQKIIISLLLSEELILESAHGRSINFRPNDDSLILNRMNWNELNKRWNNIKNRYEAIEFCKQKSCDYASRLNIFDSLDLIRETIREPLFLIIVRNGFDVVNSIINKGWLSKDGLSRDLWPYINNNSPLNIPYWVKDKIQRKMAKKMSPLLRTVLMWNIHAEIYNSLDHKKDIIEIRYENLLNKPNEVISFLEKLGTQKNSFTERWIESILSNKKDYDKNKMFDLIYKEDADIASKFLYLNNTWKY